MSEPNKVAVDTEGERCLLNHMNAASVMHLAVRTKAWKTVFANNGYAYGTVAETHDSPKLLISSFDMSV